MAKKNFFKKISNSSGVVEAAAGCIEGLAKGFCEDWAADLIGGVTKTIVENNKKYKTIDDLFNEEECECDEEDFETED